MIFFINPPLAALGIWAALRYVPESRDAAAPARIDWGGAALATAALGGLVFALIEGPQRGWNAVAIAAAVLGVGCAIAFVLVERRRQAPMLPLDLFAALQFRGANAATLAIYFALSGVFFLLVIQLQRVLGYSRSLQVRR